MLVIIISVVAIYDISNSQTSVETSANSFIQEPVVDILIPNLFRETSTGGQNVPLNVTTGQTDAIVIQIYPTVELNLTMEFRYYFLSSIVSTSTTDNLSRSISATFDPSNLKISAGSTANTTMTLQVSPSAPLGEYNAVVSAFSSENSSEVWGVIVRINVQ
jgi:hypothetical protein